MLLARLFQALSPIDVMISATHTGLHLPAHAACRLPWDRLPGSPWITLDIDKTNPSRGPSCVYDILTCSVTHGDSVVQHLATSVMDFGPPRSTPHESGYVHCTRTFSASVHILMHDTLNSLSHDRLRLLRAVIAICTFGFTTLSERVLTIHESNSCTAINQKIHLLPLSPFELNRSNHTTLQQAI